VASDGLDRETLRTPIDLLGMVAALMLLSSAVGVAVLLWPVWRLFRWLFNIDPIVKHGDPDA